MTYPTMGAARDAAYKFLTDGLTSELPAWTKIIIFDDKNTPAPPVDQRPYIRAQFRHTMRDQSSIGGAGGRRFRSKFQLTLKIYTQLGKGMDDYKIGVPSYPGQDTIGDALLRIFEGKSTAGYSMSFFKVQPQEYGEDEGRYRMNVLVRGDYDTVR